MTITRYPPLLICLVGCTDTRPAITGTQSLEITLVSPSDPGAVDRRLPDTQRSITIDVHAKDETNELDTSFTTTLQVYAQFLGTLTPSFGETPLDTIQITNGVATGKTITLPNVFGATVLWVDDGTSPGPAYEHGKITGTTPILWFRDPFIADLQTPRDLMGLDALTAEPLQDKQISIGASRHGASGRLVVNSVFAQGYTVSDLQCADDRGTPPCTAGDFDHAMVFSFSAPKDGFGNRIEQGQVITGFAGGLSEFLGLTEVGFPQTFTASSTPEIDLARLPPPTLFARSWFNGLNDPNGMINFEKNEAGPIQVNNAKVCNLDKDFDDHKQWKLDPAGVGGDCLGNKDVINVVTTGITGIDPAALVGTTLPRVVGVLRPLNFGGSGNVWLIFPRSIDDLTLQ